MLKRCSSDVEKCLERVIRKYDPDDEEVCFPFKQGYHSCLLSCSGPFSGTAKQVLNRRALGTR